MSRPTAQPCRHLRTAVCLILPAIAPVTARAQDEPFSWTPIPYRLPSTTQQIGDEMWLTVQPQAHYYFGWERSTDMFLDWQMADMALGSAPATFHFLPDLLVPRQFYRVRAINLWSPGDADGDCIDDVWELRNGLDPVLAADAHQPSAADPLLTNLEYYRRRFGLLEANGRVPVKEYFSDEVSIANWPGAISPEISVFRSNDAALTQLEALSAEVSVFKRTETTLTSLEAISDEVSVFRFSALPAWQKEATSDEVSVFRFSALPAWQKEAISDEVSVFRFSSLPVWQKEAISPEVSVEK
jgi:hypothetical protein